MKKSKFILSSLVLSVMTFNSLSIVSADGINTENPTIEFTHEVIETPAVKTNTEPYSLQVQFRQTLNIPTNISEKEMTDLIPIMNTTGWEYNAIENIFERFVAYEGLEVATQDNANSVPYDTKTTDIKGNVVISSPAEDQFNIKITDPKSKLSFNKKLNASNSENGSIIIDVDFSSMLANDAQYMLQKSGADISPMASSTDPYWVAGELGYTGKRLHCNRFNGPNGDNRYWSHFSAQGLKNFVGSDCDTSASVTLACLADDIPALPNHCEAGIAPDKPNSKEATCSGEQGLSRYFHFR
ncbi:hypothetical protein [Paenibacillus polymyxa]|uniref:hypothetical protein n=1 Tax=Paenibacillus polymyxa TaxID=1406 RepID=UPI0032AF77A4